MKENVVAPSGYLLLTGLCLIAVGFSGCASERSRLLKEEYPSYPEGVRRTIDRGTIIRGMNQDQVFLALGSPVCKTEIQDQGRAVQVWLYPPIGRDACVTADFRVYFEEGVVTTWDHFTTPTRYTDPAGGMPAY
jgi:hypothetical protein